MMTYNLIMCNHEESSLASARLFLEINTALFDNFGFSIARELHNNFHWEIKIYFSEKITQRKRVLTE